MKESKSFVLVRQFNVCKDNSNKKPACWQTILFCFFFVCVVKQEQTAQQDDENNEDDENAPSTSAGPTKCGWYHITHITHMTLTGRHHMATLIIHVNNNICFFWQVHEQRRRRPEGGQLSIAWLTISRQKLRMNSRWKWLSLSSGSKSWNWRNAR